MNSALPVSSSIGAVDFVFLHAEEIRKLSVKRITSRITFDSLLNPVAGGLYDPALGAFSDNNCSTCHLNTHSCPGHCGHVELPVFVYHCVFMDQAYRLLRAQCIFCNHFRLSKAEINLYCCKLRLIQFGLLEAARQLEDIVLKSKGDKDDSEDDAADELEQIIQLREKFVRRAIKQLNYDSSSVVSSEAISEARKAVILDFQASILKTRRCKRCKAYSPQYRKNRYSGVFRKPLNSKEQAANARQGQTSYTNPLTQLNKKERNEKRQRIKDEKEKNAERRRTAEQIDEGVADMDSSQDDQMDLVESEEEDMGEELGGLMDEKEGGEELDIDDENESMLQTEASGRSVRKKASLEHERQVYLNANEVRASLMLLFQAESEVLTLVYSSASKHIHDIAPSADMFFVSTLLVPPNKYRKEQKTGPEEISESPDNEAYRNILGIADEIFDIRREIAGELSKDRLRPRGYDDLQNSWIRLQEAVNTLFDKEKNSARGPALLRIPNGIKQKLEKKEGMFRMNIMGKRVNFAARSVISPDPNLESNEIGVPPVFAKRLYFPEPVTSHNFEEMKEAVKNGPDVWPGAIAIENEKGQVQLLRTKNAEERQALANMLLAPTNSSMSGVKNKKVHRHLNNGDILIMNRQPTLHKPSMMCHRARVLPGEKTIRMHYANCNTYNADFDGDEMNMHFPQNELARTEALMIADTDHQYLSATAGKPLRGLIQDHISMGVWLCCVDTMFTREEYQELLYSSIRPENNHTTSDRIKLVDPALIRPRAMWTGKQIISTILLNITPSTHPAINVLSPSQTPPDRWGPNSEDGLVRIENGDMLTGVIDKKQIGPTAGGVVHTVYETYGHTVAGKFLSILGRMLTRLLNMRAFSCGVEDLVMTPSGEATRHEKLKGAEAIGLGVAAKYVSMQDANPADDDPELLKRLESVLRDDDKQSALDLLMNSQSQQLSSAITEACLRPGLKKDFPKNQMQAMTTSGAKGSVVNANLISCNLGQQVLEGRRVPVMVSGKSLPCFKPFETNIRAGGYIKDRFLTGVNPQEYYFHTMAGREGLIDTAVKTARSGYLQRCLIKGMEGLRAEHDSSVRDSDGTMIQTLYGEDGLEITKQRNLMDFKFIARNFRSIAKSLNSSEKAEATRSEEAEKWNRSAVKKVDRTGDITIVDPVGNHFAPGCHAGSTSEKFYRAVQKYIEQNTERVIREKREKSKTGEDVQLADTGKKDFLQKVTEPAETFSQKTFARLVNLNYLRSVVEPGEAVGVVAGQSIGEPSTQMTLNTFHLAGHSAKNVTLGIPRLREILMTASKTIKTPVMTLFPISEMTPELIQQFSKGISRLSLAELIDEIRVQERIGRGAYPDARIYDIKLKLFPADEYQKEYAVTVGEVSMKLKTAFVKHLDRLIKLEFRKRGTKSEKLSNDAHPEIGQSSRKVRDEVPRGEAQNEGGDSDDDDGGDDDATNAKKRTNLDEGVTYEDPDDSDVEIARDGERDASPDAGSEDDESQHEGPPANNDGDAEDSDGDESQKDGNTGSEKEDLDGEVVKNNKAVTQFSFDRKRGDVCKLQLQFDSRTPKILMLPLVTRAVHSTLIRAIPHLAASTTSKEKDPFSGSKDEVAVVLTEGVNLLAMREFQNVIDPHKIVTNDVGAVLATYGVEAARSIIIRELHGVFEGHSIDVDRRHLTLVADYMTRGGDYQPFNRIGMRDKPSPFMKMSFETTFGFLRDAVTSGEGDDLSSPSARITMGKIGRMGTGMFDVLMPLS